MVRPAFLFVMTLAAAPAIAAPASDSGRGWRLDTGGVAVGIAMRAWHAVDVGDVAAAADGLQGQRVSAPRVDPSRVGEDPSVYGRVRPNGMIANLSASLKF